MLEFIFVGALLGWGIYLWFWLRERYSHWVRKGVEGPRPLFLLGNTDLLRRPMSTLYTHLYNAFPSSPIVGFFEFTRPKLLIRDPQLIQQVLVKDFGFFVDRVKGSESIINEVDDVLFTMRGKKWKAVRAKITPAFTSGKIRLMVPQMCDWGFQLMRSLESKCNVDIELRDLTFSFTTGVIASTAFGLDPQSICEPDSKFREMAMQSLQFNPIRFLKLMVLNNFPSLATYLRISFTPKEVASFFSKVIKDTLAERQVSGVLRNDFVQLLLQLKDKGYIDWTQPDPDDEYLQQQPSPYETLEITDTLLISQAFTFLSAGSEPLANTLTFAMYELAMNLEVQEKARAEVEAVLTTHRSLTFEALKQMEYLEKCISETLRIYPVVQQLFRLCTQDYKFSEEGVLVEEGTDIIIPTAAIHHDPLFYPEPFSFMPERFYDSPNKGAYTPFGDGPRTCIAMRFSQIELKVFLACLLHSYRLLPSPKTKKIELNRWSFFTSPNHQIYLTFLNIHPKHCKYC